MRVKTKIKYKLVLCLGFLLSGSLSQAQTSLPDAEPSTKDSLIVSDAEDSVFSVSSMTLLIEEANQRIHEISNNMVRGDTITKLFPEYTTFSRSVRKLVGKLDSENLSTYSLSHLQSVRNKLFRYKTRLNTWQDNINDRSETLTQQKKELISIREEFEINNWSSDTTLADLYLDRLRQIRLEDSLVNQNVNANLRLLVEAQNQLAELKIIVNNYLDDLDTSIQSYQLSLFDRNAAPVWSSVAFDDPPQVYQQLTLHAENNLILLRDYLSENKVNMYLHLGILVILVLLLYSVRDKAEALNRSNQLPKLGKMLYVLKYPWCAALLITLVIGPVLYLHPPSIMIQIFFIFMLVPLIVIVSGRGSQRENLCTLLLGLAFLLAEIENTQVESSLAHRVMVLITTISGLSSIILFVYRPKLAQDTYPAFFRWMLLIFILLFVVAIGANLLGFVALAVMLNLATVQSLIFGLLLFFSYRVISVFILLVTYSKSLQRSRMMRENQQVISKNLISIASLGLSLYWVVLTLATFNVYDITYEMVSEFLVKERELGTIVFSYWSILVFILVVWASITISRLIRYFLEQQYTLSSSSEKNKKGAYILLLRYFVLVVGFVLAIVAAGIPIDKVTIILGALSVGIGFGLQTIVNNLVSGLILALERPIQIGDVVEVSNYMGTVKDIGIRSSTIKTFDGSEVIIPNANFISGEVTNWTLSDKHYRIEIMVGVAYGSNSEKVTQVLKSALEDQEEIMNNPEPMVLFHGFGESSLDFRILFWCRDRNNWILLRSSVMEIIYQKLNEAKISIPFPQRDLHIKSELPQSNGHTPKPMEKRVSTTDKAKTPFKDKPKLN